MHLGVPRLEHVSMSWRAQHETCQCVHDVQNMHDRKRVNASWRPQSGMFECDMARTACRSLRAFAVIPVIHMFRIKSVKQTILKLAIEVFITDRCRRQCQCESESVTNCKI